MPKSDIMHIKRQFIDINKLLKEKDNQTLKLKFYNK